MLGLHQQPLPISFDQIPKTEQHVHIEATTSLELLAIMAERNGLLDIFQEIRPFLYQFNAKNFLEFLTSYDLVSLFINTPKDVKDMIVDYLRRCKEEGLTHVAMTCSYDHTKEEREIFIDFNKQQGDYTELENVAERVRQRLKGREKAPNLTYQQYVDAVASAIDQGMMEGISAEVIMVILRHNPIEKAQELIKEMADYPHPYVTTLGLAGDEVNNPASKFTHTFATARTDLGLKIAPHVCELAPPQYLHDALTQMGPLCRVGHAITAPTDQSAMQRLFNLSNPATYFLSKPGLPENTRLLLQRLQENGILENDVDEANLKAQLVQLQFQDEASKECLAYLFQPLCVELSPTSNLLLIEKMDSLADHPLPTFISAGIRISINSDDPKFWSDRVKGANFDHKHFNHPPQGSSVGQEWDKVQRLYGLTDAQMLKIYRDSVVSMGCHKLLKIRLLKHADLYEAFHALKEQLAIHQNGSLNHFLETYQKIPSALNAQALLGGIRAITEEIGLQREVQLAQNLVSKHAEFAKAISDYQQYREGELIAFKARSEVKRDSRKEIVAM